MASMKGATRYAREEKWMLAAIRALKEMGKTNDEIAEIARSMAEFYDKLLGTKEPPKSP